MAKEKYIQFIASFLIGLVLTIPFYTVSVYAGIGKVTVKGSDGIEGFAKGSDFLSFTVQANISNDASITRDQVVLGSGIQFDNCNPSASSGFECILRFPNSGTENFEVKSIPLTINLFKDDRTLNDSKSSSITIDNKAPQVSLSLPRAKFSAQQNVTINYDATDFACDDPSCANKCVGLKSIEFYTLDNSFRQTVEITSSNCNKRSSIGIEAASLNDGRNSVFAKATDKFNLVSAEASATFIVDKSPPSILANSFAIIRKGVILSTFARERVAVEIFINISGNDLDRNNVIANLSELNPSLKFVKASCASGANDVNTCKWSIDLNPRSAGSKTIIINASDTSGNTESATVTKQLTLDDKGPVVQSLSLPATRGAQALAKPSGNSVTAAFDDSTGLSANEVFLHVGGSRISAKSCNKETNWNCVFENVNFGSSNRLSIEADTLDVLGNAISELKSLDVTIDRTAPVLRGINMSNVGGLTQAFPGIFKIGDKIAIEANILEENDVFAVADFSKFVDGASKIDGTCQKAQADEHVCTWLTDSINLEASDSVRFNFSDNAGNTLMITKPLKTFGLESAEVPDFWTNSVQCSPKAVDRQLGPLINQRVFCQVSLKQKSTTKSVSTVFIGPASCTSNPSILQSLDTFNTEAGSISPILKITLKKDDLKINGANLSCSFNIFSRIGSSTTVTKNPEIENVNINLEFFNLPLGEVSGEVQRKIDEAKKDAEGIWKLIGTLNKLMFYAKKICQIINMLYNIVAVLYNIVFILTGYEIIATKTPGGFLASFFTLTKTNIAGCQTETSTRVVSQNMNSGLNKFCAYVNCKQTFLWGPEAQNWINSKFNALTPGSYIGGKYELQKGGLLGFQTYASDEKGEIRQIGFGRPVSEYMDPNHNLAVATLFVCLPGVVYGLDKYRQVKCLYADCLQNAVAREGLPVTACEDQKAYATCKYIFGELFAVFPWTAVFDHFLNLIKNSLSNPFTALGAAISFGCTYTCPNPNAESRLSLWTACEGFRLFSQIGSIAGDVKNMIDEGFKIRQDYCSRLKNNEASPQPAEQPAQKTTQGSGPDASPTKK
ncbi:MAG: hypothetical protein AABX33_07705 [Nanoarchaeota archaeon]